MSELIEKRDAYHIIKDMVGLVRCDVLMDAYDNLKKLPAIDAVPVVRCKECDNWATEFSSGRKSLGNYRCLCQEWSDAEDHRFTYTGENEYCSRGERRE